MCRNIQLQTTSFIYLDFRAHLHFDGMGLSVGLEVEMNDFIKQTLIITLRIVSVTLPPYFNAIRKIKIHLTIALT